MVAKRLPRVLLLALALGAAGCMTLRPPAGSPGPGARVLEGVEVGRFGSRQCAAGSLATVLNYLGDPVSVAELDAALPRSRNGGVLSLDLVLAARARGHEARLIEGDPERVLDLVHGGSPVVLMIRMLDAPGRDGDLYHYLVVDGADPARGLVRLQFGDGKTRWTSLERLSGPWRAAGRAALLVRGRRAEDADAASTLRYAVALEAEGEIGHAAGLYQRLVTSPSVAAVAWTNLGNVRAQRGERAAAEEAYRRALESEPDDADALNNLAWLLLEDRERAGEAEALARRALEVGGPDPHLVLDTLGRALRALGRCAEAIEAMEQAVDSAPVSSPDLPQLRRGLAEVRLDCAPPRSTDAAAASPWPGGRPAPVARRPPAWP